VIENKGIEFRLRQAETAVALAETELILVGKGARFEDIEQAENALVAAKNSLKIADDDYRRMQALFESGSVTAKQRDDAQARAAIAQAQYASAGQALNKVKNISRPEEIRVALLKRDQARLSLESAKDDVDHLTIRAPLDGILTHKLVEEGELVFPGSGLFAVSDLSVVTMTLYVSEKDLARVFVGLDAQIEIDAYPGRRFEGKVVSISPEAEFTPKNVQTRDDRVKLVFGVKLSIPNSDEIFKPGMPADAYLEARKEQ